MKRFGKLTVLVALMLGLAGIAQAATEVKMTGDARVYGVYFANHNYTGWSTDGTQTEDRFQIWERFRLRSDFVANEAVKFRLGIKVEDTWGHGTLTAANPTVAIDVYQAFLQFKMPDCDVEVTAGLQDLSFPTNSFFSDSVVFGGDRAAALTINAPLIKDTLAVTAGFARMIDTNRTYDKTTTQVADEFDAYILALPITVTGFNITPWGVVGVAGKDAAYGDAGFLDYLVSGGAYEAGWKNDQNAYWWAGATFEVTALDPVKFYGDVIYGAGAENDRKWAKRQGWFIDAGVEYTGWDVLTPQLFGWWSTGEDSSNRNGSERLPQIVPNWGPGNSFLFDDTQELGKESNMGVNPVGNWGLGLSLNNISFVEKLSHILTFTYLRGNNNAKSIRALNYTMGTNSYYVMGRDLTKDEYLLGLNFDTKYMIYENLAAIVETGWSHGEFQSSVWGHRLASKSRDGDAWKVAFGLTYKF
ncbi:MAG: outer membrane homotrimeric porin [Solidesulfovibrio sp. DCME]|uniref:outer membrane homotrimeric porin n=1 Tax=Solidesulfovibrio sp. DCME TaxID=3447380 RepID=UPI003D0A7C77